ncbi:MAG TPA: hypothetical protein DEB39_09400, partial [Planctomycetaceae bacterium]|nr:hypothetical protein [Planctomycetaceae bacterium]
MMGQENAIFPGPHLKRSCMMSMIRYTVLLYFTCIAAASFGADQFLRERQAEFLYDRGVHSFFDQDYTDAIAKLKKVEVLESVDPRPYYFLGLSYNRIKDKSNADKYLKKASRLEWEGRSARDYRVSDALKRIQGRERLQIESYRKQAKRNWEKVETKRLETKFNQTKAEENAILAAMRKQPEPIPEAPEVPFVGTAPFGARSVDPFRSPEKENEARDRLIPADDQKPDAAAVPPEPRPETSATDSPSTAETDKADAETPT